VIRDLDRIPAFFAKWIAENGNRGAVGEVAQWLSSGALDGSQFEGIVARRGCVRDRWFQDAMVDFVLEYARERLSQGPPSVPDVSDIRALRAALHVPEGAFFERRRAEVSSFIQTVFDSILEDGVIDGAEDLYLVEVQTAFSLSYDQLLVVARPALERALLALRTGIGLPPERSPGERQRTIIAINSLYSIAVAKHRTLGALL
jgi:hypothetical protein